MARSPKSRAAAFGAVEKLRNEGFDLLKQITDLMASLGNKVPEEVKSLYIKTSASKKFNLGNRTIWEETLSPYRELLAKLKAVEAGGVESDTDTPEAPKYKPKAETAAKPKKSAVGADPNRPPVRTTVPIDRPSKVETPDPASDVDPETAALVKSADAELEAEGMPGFKRKDKPGFKSRASSLRKSAMGKGLKYGALAGLAAVLVGRLGRERKIQPLESTETAQRLLEQSRSQKITKLLEQARIERMIQENQARIARSDPRLYTSVLAGRSVPTNSVVLGGRPRMDLMQELAASMGSGRFDRPDPLSELIG